VLSLKAATFSENIFFRRLSIFSHKIGENWGSSLYWLRAIYVQVIDWHLAPVLPNNDKYWLIDFCNFKSLSHTFYVLILNRVPIFLTNILSRIFWRVLVK
jgi:hypothetical protein